MNKTLSTCPTCGQALADASLAARVKESLAKLEAARAADFERKERQLRADVARERRQLQKTTEEKFRSSFAAKLRAIEDRQKESVSAAILKARGEERRRSDRALEQMRKQNDETQRRLQRLTADERGDIGEADIVAALQQAFPGDLVERLGKDRGFADIRHTVREHGRACV
jgi:DNA repair exonuclease SbcCD ATPase subunit